ncbi:MAG: DUF4159 domain-containing protein [Phycisphaerales bacterium]
MRRIRWALVLICLNVTVVMGAERITMWGTPPKEQPHFTKAAEGFPPLPLPVVPQRRTEKKRPPAPPKLLANLSGFGFRGWQGSPGAVDTLLRNGRKHLDLWYGWEQLDIATLERKFAAGVTHPTPILYLCVYYPLDLTDTQRQALQKYTLDGGTLLINCCGQQAAFDSAQSELAQMFPDHPLALLPADHPLYHSYYQISSIKYLSPTSVGEAAFAPGSSAPGTTAPPRIHAIELGTRAAVILSREDLACGWNQWNNASALRVDATDSTRLGLNIITYVTAEQRLARFLAHTTEVAGPTVRPRAQLTFVQLIHDGNWDPNPSAVPLLLKDIAANTSIAVQFERKTIAVRDPALFGYPMLYMTGTTNPRLRKDEIVLLRRWLDNGGVLIADAAAGRSEFDAAFRALCEQLYPDHPLRRLPADHPVFKAFYEIKGVAENHEAQPVAPDIQAVVINDRPSILYSPLGLCDGWAHQFSAYAKCYLTPDALKLGTNLIVYAMQ